MILPSTIPPCWQSSSQSKTCWSGWKIKLASELPGDYSVLAIGWKSILFEKTKFSKTFPPTTNEMVQGQFFFTEWFPGSQSYVIIIITSTMLVYLLFKLQCSQGCFCWSLPRASGGVSKLQHKGFWIYVICYQELCYYSDFIWYHKL